MAQLDSTVIYGNLKVTGDVYGYRVYGAVYNAGNDYAEYRLCRDILAPGYIVTEDETDCDYVKLCKTKKPKGKCFVISDTYATCIGDELSALPVALSGRVLVYPEKDCKFKVGDKVGVSINGKARKIRKLESLLHPDRVIGTVSSIPNYNLWVTAKKEAIDVDGRIWVNLK